MAENINKNFLNSDWWAKATVDDVEAEIAKGADVNISDNLGLTPLMYAVGNSENPEITKLLIKNGADINAVDKNGASALMHAAEWNNYSENDGVIDQLIQLGANKELRDETGWSYLMYSAKWWVAATVDDIEKEISKGADIKALNNREYLFIYDSIGLNTKEVISKLISLGVDINAKLCAGTTLLTWFCTDKEMLNLLLKNNPEVNKADDFGNTPLIALCYNAFFLLLNSEDAFEIVKTLINHGADVNLKNNDNKTALDYAAEAGNKEIVDIINFLNKPIISLKLSVRTLSCLKNMNILYIRDLLNKSPAEYLRTPNFGRKSLIEIQQLISLYGLSLKNSNTTNITSNTEKVSKSITYEYIDNIEEKINIILDSLSSQDKDVIKRFYGLNCNKHTFSQIAGLYNVSTTRVGQIVHKAVRKLKHQTRSGELKNYYHADNLFNIYGNIMHKRYSYINLLENMLGELPGNYSTIREKNEKDRDISYFYVNKRETLYVNKNVNLDLCEFISDPYKFYSDEELSIIVNNKLKNILNSDHKEHYDMVIKALLKIFKEKYFNNTKNGYKVKPQYIDQINEIQKRKDANMVDLHSNNKKQITIDIDEEVYDTFINMIGETKLDNVIEQLINQYISQTSKKQKKNDKTSNSYFAKVYDKIPNWAKKPNQFNSTIVWAYFRAEDIDGQATLSRMRGLCLDKMSEQQFKSNYFQMTFDGSNSHGKVFEDDGENVWIWEEIKPRLMQYKNAFYKGE